jgi:hypothetical protein
VGAGLYVANLPALAAPPGGPPAAAPKR